jgi:hypothetical protein
MTSKDATMSMRFCKSVPAQTLVEYRCSTLLFFRYSAIEDCYYCCGNNNSSLILFVVATKLKWIKMRAELDGWKTIMRLGPKVWEHSPFSFCGLLMFLKRKFPKINENLARPVRAIR